MTTALRPGDPRRLGAYSLLGRLGEGGMGTVFLGRDGAGQLVAVKVIRPEFAAEDELRARFRSEVNRARQVPPFCTAEVLDADPDHATPYLVVEYVDGPSLAEVVADQGPLPATNLHGVAVGVATALAAIHGAGVIHRDLKPRNVLFSLGTPKVIDFGIARALESTSQHTRTSQMVGSIAYMAPERFDTDTGTVVSPAADVFAWGAVVGYAGNGRTPFAAGSPTATAMRILTQPPALGALISANGRLQPAVRPSGVDRAEMRLHSASRQTSAVRTHTTMAHSPGMEHLTDELNEFRPTFLLSVPRMFEKVHSRATQQAKGPVRGRIFRQAERTAIAYSQALQTPPGPGRGLRLRRGVFDWMVYRRLRAAFGGRCAHAISGGAPLNTRLGHFFRGAGVSILEGYGLTETSAAATANPPGVTRIGTVGRPLPGAAIRIDDDGEILIRGDLVIRSYWNNPDATAEAMTADGWLRSGDLGEFDNEGFLRVTGRKKEIIVTAAGKHVARTMLEERVRAHPLVSHCVVIGDRQPFVAALVSIDHEVWPKWLAEHGRPRTTSVAEMREDHALCAEIQTAINEANQAVSHPEAIKKFRILPRDFTEENGELTATLKVKRDVVQRACADQIAALYQT